MSCRFPFFPVFCITLLCSYLAVEGLFAQDTVRRGVSQTKYTPGRGLVGYTRGASAAKKRASGSLVPPPENLDNLSDSSGGDFAESPFLSESMIGTVPPNSVSRTAAVINTGDRKSGLAEDGGFIPDSVQTGSAVSDSEPLVFDSEPNTFTLTPTSGGYSGAENVKGASVLPEPVLESEPEETGAYSSIGAFLEESGTGGGDAAVADTYAVQSVRSIPFQQASGNIEHIPNVGELKSGKTTFGASVRMSVIPTASEHKVTLTPHFAFSELTMPEYLQPSFGEQEKLYALGVRGIWLAPLSECFSLDLGLDASWNSDFNSSSNKAFRLTGRVVGVWRWNETARVLLGAEYWDIDRWKIVPVFGISWHPTDECYLDLLFPTTKIGRRITWMKGIPEIDEGNSPYWVYLSGGLSADQWDTRINAPEKGGWGERALISYTDCRILGGIEKKVTADVNWAIEGGLVFSRRLTVEGSTPSGYEKDEITPKTSGIARLRVSY